MRAADTSQVMTMVGKETVALAESPQLEPRAARLTRDRPEAHTAKASVVAGERVAWDDGTTTDSSEPGSCLGSGLASNRS